ncbi:hypothetical protein GUITHDRAFT_162650 [Guillardia theta CCMP2712]|uniref:Uncharacterized protein n=1 Tax=Guillardia theta (strain CCMP2712) TaxID=905079 RepID=L1JHJ6_GUITC|nr:hypothetical protein GUITHDRAFT_162650 [Guillardia theta CCMP2712]EKX47575.1 hypothetical protein GUITHDRAFT_162650 [Guillardia theta CCMP2712]|eukprot:XP_005834555.1 hypothetical protein GUITHDRAFT_162650 [Guillardia theta CCMP2712]
MRRKSRGIGSIAAPRTLRVLNLCVCILVTIHVLVSWSFLRRAVPSGGVELGEEAISFDWREVLPELQPVWDQFRTCSEGLRAAVHMQHQRSREDEGWVRRASPPARSFYSAISDGNASMKDRSISILPGVRDRGERTWASFISTGQASHHILGSSGTHFATTHHLGSISYRKNGTPCSRKLKELVSSTLKHGGLQYTDADDSFRGLYWYPPNGFTEWHTDGGQVEGWRLYLTDVEEENQSGFVYQAKDGVRRVGDRKFQANMFRLAVYSTNTTRFSMGIAISHGLAMKIVRQLNKLPSR